jgi:hypothetical protein
MAATSDARDSSANDWDRFSFDDEPTTTPRLQWSAAVDTSRMSWRDCHIGFLLVVLCCVVISPFLNIAVLVGFVAGLNGSYAMVFSQRPPGHYSRPIWWLALVTSLSIASLFALFEIDNFLHGGIPWHELLVIALVLKLASGQLMFLGRIRRERPLTVLAENIEITDSAPL